jgi:hypothetical protein
VRIVETFRVGEKCLQTRLGAKVNDLAVILGRWEIIRIGPEHSLTNRVETSVIRCFGDNRLIIDETICQGWSITSPGLKFLRQRCHTCFIFYPYMMIFILVMRSTE